MLTVMNTTVAHNHAQGGEGRAGGTGGMALGGGPGGQGIGGGVYHFGGAYSADVTTVIEKNHASTSGDNVAP